MSINLALILTALTAVSGVVVLLDRFVWKTANGTTDATPRGLSTLVDYSRSFFPVLLFVLVVRSFIFEPFRIPSGSMKPTLLTGDFIFVKKYSYGLRLPVTETKIVDTGSPQRGDVVVFRLPSEPSINYIKRVIGLPGDEVVYRQQRLTINGELVPLRSTDEIFERGMVYLEHFGDRAHDVLIENTSYSKQDGVYRIPEGYYFMMGDNRDNSKDSRFIGAIAEEYLVGEAVRVWMHWVPWNMPRWDRIGGKIQ